MDRHTRASLRRALGRAVSVAVVAWILSGLVRAQGTAEAALVLAAVVLSLLSLPVEVLAASGWGRDRVASWERPGGQRHDPAPSVPGVAYTSESGIFSSSTRVRVSVGPRLPGETRRELDLGVLDGADPSVVSASLRGLRESGEWARRLEAGETEAEIACSVPSVRWARERGERWARGE